MVIRLGILSCLLLRESQNIQLESKNRDVPVLELLGNHPIHFYIFMSYLQHLLDICWDAALICSIAHKQEHHRSLCLHHQHQLLVDL